MNMQNALGACALTLALSASADNQQDFNVAYGAYREAVAYGRYGAALQHAVEARRLGEVLYAEDPEKTAIVVFNHGFVLGKLKRHAQAYPVLKQARKLVREAFGAEAKEMIQVEIALIDSAPPSFASSYLEDALSLARTHHERNTGFIADLKLHGALRLWNRDTVSLLEDAAQTYRANGNTDGHALAQFWTGKKHLAERRYRKASKPFTTVVDELPPDHRLVLMARAHLVEAFEQLGQSERATEHCLAIGRTRPWTGNADYQPLFKRPPNYPRSALSRMKEGHVIVTFTVDEMGFVRNPKVVDSKGGAMFHKPALEAAKEFRYAPKFVDGEPVPVEGVQNLIRFLIRG